MSEYSQKQFITAKGMIWTGFVFLSLLLSTALITDYYFLPFVLIFGVLWVVVNIRYSFAGLIFYSLFMLIRPNEFMSVFAVPMIEKAIVAPVLLGLMWQYFTGAKKLEIPTRPTRAILGFVVVAGLSVFTSVWLMGAWDKWFQLFRLLIIYVFVVELVKSPKQFRIFCFVFMISGCFHAVSASIAYYMGIRGHAMGIDRAMGLDLSYGAPNSLAATIVYTLPFLYCFLISVRSRLMKLFLVAMAGACMWCIILTGSRTGMLGVGFVTFMIAMQYKNKVRNIAIGLVLMVVAFFAMPDQYRERLNSTTDFSGDTGASQSAQGRIDGLVNGVIMMIDRPLLGVGIGQYPVALGNIYGKGWWEAHSLPGQLFGDLGMLGTFTFVAWMYVVFAGLRKLKAAAPRMRREAVFIGNMVLAIKMEFFLLLFMGLGGHNLYRYNWFFATAMLAVLLVMIKEQDLLEAQEASDRPAI